jgi:hypothetical protein
MQKITELNDYCPVALTSVVMKCFERLVKDHISANLPATLDPLQLHTAPTAPQMTQSPSHCTLPYPIWTKKNTHVRVLFIDYSSAFNIIVPSKLIKLEALGLNPSLCDWVLDFLTGRLPGSEGRKYLYFVNP